MSLGEVVGVPPGKTPAELASLRHITFAVYLLEALSFLSGIPAIVGVIVNYVKLDETRGTIYESHFRWQMRTFWWGLLWGAVGLLLTVLVVGFAILFAAWVWVIYRVVKGWLKLNDGKPVYPAD